MTFYNFSFVNAQESTLTLPKYHSMLLENCVTKSSCCLRKFRVTAMSFKSSVKNKRFVVVSCLPDGPNWYPFNFFNKNDNGFTEKNEQQY